MSAAIPTDSVGVLSAANALELRGITKMFGALAAISDVTLSVRPGERRAVLGSNGAGKTTLFNCITGDFPATSGFIRFFGEDVTSFPPYERIRRGLRRTYQISSLFAGLSVIDNVYLACRGVSRNRYSLLRPRRDDALVHAAETLVQAVHLTDAKDRIVGELAYGQQRQLEIALALSGAPRFILFDEPAAGLSPTERRDLVNILTSLPSHIGYIIIEHDMDVALRVVESVTMMHNGRVFKEGRPDEIEDDPEVRSFTWEAAMAERFPVPQRSGVPILQLSGVNVFYGRSHAVQGVDLTLQSGVLSVVGRNGMGKTTMCKAIMGLVPISSGSIRFLGEEISGRPSAEIARLGIGYVPQGRRLWRSLTVHEHLRLMSTGKGAWTPERIYEVFPRLAERKNNGGAQLSGGEQQMLAISRALLMNPKLLIMDEPTEGLAPVIVAHVEETLVRLAAEGDVSILVIEQNIGVATQMSDPVAIMVNGRINRVIASATLAADRDLQQRLLGVGRHSHDETDGAGATPSEGAAASAATVPAEPTGPIRVYNANPCCPRAGRRMCRPRGSRRRHVRSPAPRSPRSTAAASATCRRWRRARRRSRMSSWPGPWTRRATSCATSATS